eukprot:m.482515 g.482515  ORF g.482515 m.482515 type:complete len:233 (+) comp21723_c0_seq9:2225-2923(+)
MGHVSTLPVPPTLTRLNAQRPQRMEYRCRDASGSLSYNLTWQIAVFSLIYIRYPSSYIRALHSAAAARGAALRFFTSADVHPGATQVNAVLTDQHMFSVASVFIANCISSFSAVAVRHRRITETPRPAGVANSIQPVYFWGLPLDAQYTSLQNPKEEGFFAMFTAPADHLRCKVQLGSIWVCTLAVHTHTHTPSIYSLARIYTPSVSVHIHTHTHTYTLELNHVVSTMLRYL